MNEKLRKHIVDELNDFKIGGHCSQRRAIGLILLNIYDVLTKLVETAEKEKPSTKTAKGD